MKMTRPLGYFAVLTVGCGLWSALNLRAEEPTLTADFAGLLRRGNVTELTRALDSGVPVNARDAQGNTPLMLAAIYAEAPAVKLLLSRGAEVNVTNCDGVTPLMRAATDAEKVRLLLERGAEVNARAASGNTALMLAARPARSHDAVERLLASGAKPNVTNNWGSSALMAAAAGGDATTVRLLLKYGADANAQPAADPVGFIFGGARSPLMWAAFRGDTGIMKQLLAAGADPNGEGFFGTPLSQAAWANRTRVAELLIASGADVNQKAHGTSFAPLHWAASTEQGDSTLVKLLLRHGADPNLEGGESMDAFMDIPQTPLMLAKRRGVTPVVATLLRSGATNETPDEISAPMPPARRLPAQLDVATVRTAVSQALAPLQESSIFSKQAFVSHASKQDCTSCHQQYLPLAALGTARQIQATINTDQEQELIAMVRQGELKNPESDRQALFHPDGVFTKGYTLFGYALAGLPADELTDAAVHHLATVQGADGRWYGNLPRPPMQTSDVGATALGVLALQKYPLPGRRDELAARVDKARRWLWTVSPANNDERVFQLLGLFWAGETPKRLHSLAKELISAQQSDGGWAQLPSGASDAYATGQAVYALCTAGGLTARDSAVERGRRYLLETQLADGTWYVHRRAFPFQPTTIKSGFPHGKDAWISATATSWAVIALSLPDDPQIVQASGLSPMARN